MSFSLVGVPRVEVEGKNGRYIIPLALGQPASSIIFHQWPKATQRSHYCSSAKTTPVLKFSSADHRVRGVSGTVPRPTLPPHVACCSLSRPVAVLVVGGWRGYRLLRRILQSLPQRGSASNSPQSCAPLGLHPSQGLQGFGGVLGCDTVSPCHRLAGGVPAAVRGAAGLYTAGPRREGRQIGPAISCSAPRAADPLAVRRQCGVAERYGDCFAWP